MEAAGTVLATAGVGVLGQTLFLSMMPDSPDVAVAVYEYPGSPPVETMGAGGPALDRPRIQVMCRAGRDDYPTARDLALAARTALAAVVDQTVGTVHLLRVASTGSVLPLGNDDKERPRVAVNFEVTL